MTDLVPHAETSTSTPITSKEQALILLALAVTTNDPELVRQQVLSAKQDGITNEAIDHVTALVGSFSLKRISKITELSLDKAPTGQKTSGQRACCR
jgi:hypothetical protein